MTWESGPRSALAGETNPTSAAISTPLEASRSARNGTALPKLYHNPPSAESQATFHLSGIARHRGGTEVLALCALPFVQYKIAIAAPIHAWRHAQIPIPQM
eukprot:SAG31_NODE_765_length_12248_cov_6.802947_7_plen_101_part_00